MIFLGVDTSNYTTSLAAASDGGDIIFNEKIPLQVEAGERGLRQSDAVFSHIKNLPLLFAKLGERKDIAAIGYSAFPRDAEGSYMPCFEAGSSAARSAAALLGVRAYPFSHQAGHIKAALYSSGAEGKIGGAFLAFHVSGGTTELLYIDGGKITLAGGTLDLNAGQAVDRVGVMLGLKFPCGEALSALAEGAQGSYPKEKLKICVKNLDCCLSGLENRAAELIKEGYPAAETARYTLDFIKLTVEAMTLNAKKKFGELPVLYAGGVMSSKIIRDYIKLKSGFGAYFAAPAFSCDNAAGTALLCRRSFLKTE